MTLRRLAPACLCLLVFASASSAQLLGTDPDKAPDEAAPQMGEAFTMKFRVGAEISANRGECKNIRAMVAVPFECDEQQVKVHSEDFSRHVDRVTFRDLDGGARQMLIKISNLSAGEVAKAVITYEVTTSLIEPPEDEAVADLKIPKRPDRDIRKFLTASPMIEVRDGRIRSLARDLWEQTDELAESNEEVSDWKRVEFLYDYMLKNIKYSEGPDKSALNTFKDGMADCHGRSALFVALCRANKVPARCVWVDGHCYAEFYLEDEEGAGKWFPIESAGSRAFGGMPLARTIMQKGDNFQVPERRGERLFYASDYLMAAPGSRPSVKFIREEMAE